MNFIKKQIQNIQFCIKIDNDDEDFKENFIQNYQNCFNFVILASPQGRLRDPAVGKFLYKSSSKRSSFNESSDEMYISQKIGILNKNI